MVLDQPLLMVLPCQVRSNFGTGDGQTCGNASVFHEIIVPYHDITGMIGGARDNGGNCQKRHLVQAE